MRIQRGLKTPLHPETEQMIKALQKRIKQERWSKRRIAEHPFLDGFLLDGTPVSIKVLTTVHSPEDGGLQEYAVLDRPDRTRPENRGKHIVRFEKCKWAISVSRSTGREQVIITTPDLEPVTQKWGMRPIVAARAIWEFATGQKLSRSEVIILEDGNAWNLQLSNLKKEYAARRSRGRKQPPGRIDMSRFDLPSASNENADPSKEDGAA